MTGSPAFVQLVVVGVDGSAGSTRALEWAAGIAAATGASVLAAHVLTYSQELLRDISFDTMRTWRREVERSLRSSWVEPLTNASVEHREVLVEADSPAEGLLDLAERANADLVVVGTEGHAGFASRVLGSTSYKLAHHAHQPVVVVPPRWNAAARHGDVA